MDLADLLSLPVIDANDSALAWWLCDAVFVDVPVTRSRRRALVFESVEIDAITALRVRISTHGLSN